MDVPSRYAHARDGLARGGRLGDGLAPHRGVVSERGVAVSHSLHDGTTAPLWSVLAVFRRVGVQRFTAVDIVTLVYVTFATAAVLAFSGEDHASWDLLLTAHALVVTLVLAAPLARQAGSLGRFLGDWYPMLLLGALYAEVGEIGRAHV